jgi:hypothetical protein
MSRLSRGALALSVAAGLVVGCGGGGDDEGLDLEGDRAPVSITTLPASDSVSDQAEPPELETTGDDFEQVMRSIHRFEQWMLAHPDSPLGTEIYQPNSPAATTAFTLFVDSVQRGVITRIEGSEIVSVEVVDQPDANTVDLRYTDTRTATERVDAETGEVVDRQEFDGETFTFDARLVRGFDGKWRLLTVRQVDTPDAG